MRENKNLPALAQTMLPAAPRNLFDVDRSADADLSFQSIKGYLRFAYAALFFLVVIVGGWATFSTIQGAVIASGQVAVDGKPQVLQHIEGGIISQIFVKEGDFVQSGAPVMKLDSTLIDANKASAETNYYANEALIARLIAEQEQSETIQWNDKLIAQSANLAVQSAQAAQGQLFYARRTTLRGDVQRLRQRIRQLQDEDRGVMSETRFINQELELITPELNKLQRLLARNLVPRTRITELERQQTRLLNERAKQQNRRTLISGSVEEAEINIAQIYKLRQEEVLTQLSEARTRSDSFNESLKTADSRTKQIFVRAPTDGIVHEMALQTIGGVVAAGQEIMKIIPKRERLILTARLLPADVDQVAIGQATNVIFSSLNLAAPPELAGRVRFLSPDSLTSEFDGLPYFSIEIEIDDSELDKLQGQTLTAGMPADIFIQTRKRTVLQYLLEPFKNTLNSTMRDG